MIKIFFILVVTLLVLLSTIESSYYYDADAPVSFVYPLFYPMRTAVGTFYYYDEIPNVPGTHSRVYLHNQQHSGKLQNLLSRVCQNKNACPTCAPALPPTTNFTSCNNYDVGGVSMSPSGTIAFPSKGFNCLFAIGTLPPNTKITFTCSDIAGGLILSPNPTSVPSGPPPTLLQAGTYTVISPFVIIVFLQGGSNQPSCTWTASP